MFNIEKKNLKNLYNNFTSGTCYGASTEVINAIINSSKEPSFDISTLALTSISTGIDFASFDFIFSTAADHFKIEMDDYTIVIPVIVGGSFLASLIGQTLATPLKNKEETGEFSFAGYASNTMDSFVSSVGFNIGSHFANSLLPLASTPSEDFIRSTSALILANLGSSLTSAEMLRKKYGLTFKDVSQDFLYSIPAVFVENILLTTVGAAIKPLLLE